MRVHQGKCKIPGSVKLEMADEDEAGKAEEEQLSHFKKSCIAGYKT